MCSGSCAGTKSKNMHKHGQKNRDDQEIWCMAVQIFDGHEHVCVRGIYIRTCEHTWSILNNMKVHEQILQIYIHT